MKQIIALLLLITCVGMVSCSNDTSETSTDIVGTNTPISDDTIANETTEPSNIVSWVTKEVRQPMFDSCKEVEHVVMQLSGYNVTASVIQSPLSHEKYNIEATKECLSEHDLLAAYTFGISTTERGNVILYPDIGQQTAYEYAKAIIAIQPNSTSTPVSEFMVEYSGQTDKALGYTSVRVELKVQDTVVDETIQRQILEILTMVYGEEYANVLCYAPYLSENIVFEAKQTKADITFRRDINDTGLVFDISVTPYVDNWLEGYGGTDYIPMLGTPEKFFDVFSDAIGSFDLRAYKRLANTMLSTYYPEYECTVPNYSSGYQYGIISMDNGRRYISLDVDGIIQQKDINKIVCPDFKVAYDIIMLNDQVLDISGDVECGVGIQSNDKDKETVKHEMFNTALQMMEMLIEGDQDLSSGFIYNESDKAYNSVKRQVNMLGLDKEVLFQYHFSETMADAFIGYLKVSF